MTERRTPGPEPSRAVDAFALTGAALLAAFFLLGGDAAAARRDFPLDDTWIHLVYARNLWWHGTLAYNPGVPESGATSVLWVFVLAPLQRVCPLPALVVGVKLMSALGAGLTAAGMARIAVALYSDRAVAWWSAAWVLLSPAYAFAALSGMEVTLASALLAWAIASVLRHRFALAGVLFGLSALARPECALVILTIAALESRRGPAVLCQLLLPPALMAGAWIAFNLSATGYPLPNTFYVKTQHAVWSHGVAYLVEHVLLAHGAVYAAATTGLAGFGLFQLRREPAVLRLLAAALPLAVIPFVHELKPTVLFYMQRYFLPFTPFDAPLVAVALCVAKRKLSSRLAYFPAVAAVLLALPALIAQRSSYLDHCRDIVATDTRPALEAIAPLPKAARVAVEGAGASRFFGEHTIIDLIGLNDHTFLHAAGAGVRPCLVMARGPTEFLVPENFLPQLSRDYALQVYAEYHVAHWAIVGGTIPHTVLAAHAKPHASSLAACQRLLADYRK